MGYPQGPYSQGSPQGGQGGYQGGYQGQPPNQGGYQQGPPPQQGGYGQGYQQGPPQGGYQQGGYPGQGDPSGGYAPDFGGMYGEADMSAGVLMEEDWYPAVVEESNWDLTKDGSKGAWTIVFRTTGPGTKKHQGSGGSKLTMTMAVNRTKNDGTPNPQGLGIMYRQLGAMGIPIPPAMPFWQLGWTPQQVAQAMVGKAVLIRVVINKWDGGENNKVKDIKPPEQGQPTQLPQTGQAQAGTASPPQGGPAGPGPQQGWQGQQPQGGYQGQQAPQPWNQGQQQGGYAPQGGQQGPPPGQNYQQGPPPGQGQQQGPPPGYQQGPPPNGGQQGGQQQGGGAPAPPPWAQPQ